MSDERPENPIEDRLENLQQYMKYTKKQLEQKIPMHIIKTRFSLLILWTKTTIFQNRDQNVILPKLEDQTVNT